MTLSRARRPRRALALALSLAVPLALAGLSGGATDARAAVPPAPSPVQGRTSAMMTTTSLPTAQIDSGVVWTVKIVGDTVYAGGNFSAARPVGAASGSPTVPRSNLLAFSLATGELTSFAPVVNGEVKTIEVAPDGTRLYIGGSFTSVDGEPRTNLAAFDTATGALVADFAPVVGGAMVKALVATPDTLYVGGSVKTGNGVARRNLMAFDASGTLLGWAPRTDRSVDALVRSPSGDLIIVGGRFTVVNGRGHRGLVALSSRDGSVRPWAAATVVKNGWATGKYAGRSGISSLSSDGRAIYGTGWVWANAKVGNLEGSFSADPQTGAINWLEDCHGDTYDAWSDGTTVYEVGHPHDCESVGGYPQAPAAGNVRRALAWTAGTHGTLWRSPRAGRSYASWAGRPAPAMMAWFPDLEPGTATGSSQAAWTVEGSGDYLVLGGEFPRVNGVAQQGLARFTRGTALASTDGPRLAGADWALSVVSSASGTARVTIPANWDRDDLRLGYELVRSGTDTPVYSTSVDSTFWRRPVLTFQDTGLDPGATYTYSVVATDGDGNRATSAPVSVTISADDPPSYARQVLADGAVLSWPLGGAEGRADRLGQDPGIAGAGVGDAPTGAVGSDVGARFSGSGSGRLASSLRQLSPDDWSAEIWFRTTSSRGGELFGFGTSQYGGSSTSDRRLSLARDGRLTFAVTQNGRHRTLTTSRTYRDGTWHHAAVACGPFGTALYVDGALARSDTSIVKGEGYYGYWRVGGDRAARWLNSGANGYLKGDLDEFAVYPRPLSPGQVAAHHATGVDSPRAAFTATVAGLDATLDAAVSTARSGGTPATYRWDLGDDSDDLFGPTVQHTFTAAGTYPVTLTVTDSSGLVSRTVRAVRVAG